MRASSPLGLSDASGEVTVGPPPYGFNRVVAPPASVHSFEHFGVGSRMALDSNGDPAVAYIIKDPNDDNDFSASARQGADVYLADLERAPATTPAVPLSSEELSRYPGLYWNRERGEVRRFC